LVAEWALGGRPRTRIILLGSLGAALLCGASALALLWLTLDLRTLVERTASASLDRRVTIGSLRIGWGTTLTVALRDLRIANADWGSVPDMVRISALSAEIDAWALFRGVLRFDKLDLEAPQVILERSGDGAVNWRFPHSGARAPAGLAIVPANRGQFPSLLDMTLHDGVLIYRTPTSRDLRLDGHSLAIRADADDQPVSLALDGTYNGAPVTLAGKTQSFVILRQASIPYGTALTVTSGSARLDFTGTMTEPLDFEGVAGRLQIAAAQLADVLKFAGADFGGSVPFDIAGAFVKQGEHWQLDQAAGKLGPSGFGGRLALDEGPPGRPDASTLSLAFADLDLQRLTGIGKRSDAIDLRLDPQPGLTVDATLSAKRLVFGALQLGDVVLRAATEPSRVTVRELEFAFAGGRMTGSGRADSVGDATRLGLGLELVGADADRIAQMLGAAAGQIAGQATGRANFATTARTSDDALPHAQGQLVVTMTEGRVARNLVEQASTDIRSLFRKREGVVPITCLLAAIDITNGTADLQPLRLRTSDTTLLGTGRIDLLHRLFEIDLRAAGGPSLFALDVPVRIAGDFAHAHVQPMIGLQAAPPTAKDGAASRFAPELKDIIERSACGR
jgi:uncharacterized protein involved in outer membrane biogenesis